MIFVSSSEEMALGEKSYKEALSEAKVITNTKDAKRVKTIGQKIAQVSQKNDFNWEFNLLLCNADFF
jgi:predicted Zn-dependent protease